MEASLLEALGPSRTVNSIVLPNPVRLMARGQEDRVTVEGGVRRIVACGRLVPVKAFATLVRAFASLPDDLRKGWVLEIVGDGPEMSAILSEVESLGVARDVRMLGRRDDPMAVFSGAEIGVISSEKEGFPNVLLEMMVAGVSRIVSTPCFGGCLAIDGLIVSKDCSAASLADAMGRALRSKDDRSGAYLKRVHDLHSLRRFASVVVGEE